ncbi:DNA recombination protein RmuC [Candidatus Profftia tarda]|uniref:DNA recombination protein RmuC n=1 Tax=Candidatus Profftia tarda TaxID=1177216 RepID=A0A8E4EYY0_9ENTR|nr:DNA recombination protein RmuC [Candidatus Profftia tarda]CAD6513063.1 DNA recombination protein RmuC homolog [Candidatus Profftia tarda]
MDATIWYAMASGLLFGILFGWLITSVQFQQQKMRWQSSLRLNQDKIVEYQQYHQDMLLQQQREKAQGLRILYTELVTIQNNINQQSIWRNECEQLKKKLCALRTVNGLQEIKLQEVTLRLEETKLSAIEERRLLAINEQRLKDQFENLANRIFEHNGKRVEDQNRQSLNILLSPLREQLEGFRRQVQDSFGQESRERHTLAHEIRNLQQLNEQMTRETINLTRALKGDNRTQGSWGEVVLKRVLEASGLREGHEYHTQVSVQVGSNGRMRPDVVVRLPQGKDVVIDSKMSLVAYERYFNAEDEKARNLSLEEHVASVKSHIRQLGSKNYHGLPGLRSLDYVLMFIPIEPAFLAALNYDFELISEALRNNVMLVSPTTLLVALRTISNLWRNEYQSQNTQKIAYRASKLYDKMRLFVDDMESLGDSLDKAQASYNQAMKKLSQGRGNLIGHVESFRLLGVEVKKPISPLLVNEARFNNECRNNQYDDNGHKISYENNN